MADMTFGTDVNSSGTVPPINDNPNNGSDSTPLDSALGVENDGITHLGEGKDGDDKGKPKDDNKPNDTPDNNGDDKDKEKDKDKGDDNKLSLLDQAVPGAEFEIDNTKYIVDTEGNLVDEQGNIFKKKDELEDYFKSLDQSDEDGKTEMTLANVINAIGIDILDDDDKPVQFENTPEGLAQYVDAVIKTSQQEIAETTINSLYDRYPILKDVLDYYLANGNSLDGFTGREDRESITIDENNEKQQEDIIRLAWKERGQKIDDSYIAYLKSSGLLLQTAEQELENIKEQDKAERQRLADEAKAAEQRALQENQAYWNGVKQVIDGRKVAGYEIPQTILIQKEGKQIAVTPNDFFNYLYQIDKDGYTRYQRDLMKQTPESRRDDEILRAFLTFTGGSYANLVDMAIKEKEAIRLRSKAKEAGAHKTTIKVSTPQNNKKDINFGN